MTPCSLLEAYRTLGSKVLSPSSWFRYLLFNHENQGSTFLSKRRCTYTSLHDVIFQNTLHLKFKMTSRITFYDKKFQNLFFEKLCLIEFLSWLELLSLVAVKSDIFTYNALWFPGSSPTFRRNVLPSSVSKSMLSKQPGWMVYYSTLRMESADVSETFANLVSSHGVTSQKTVLWNVCFISPFHQMDRENVCSHILFRSFREYAKCMKTVNFQSFFFCTRHVLLPPCFTRFNFSLCSRSSFSRTLLCLVHRGTQVCLCSCAFRLRIFCSVWRVLPYCAG